MKSTSNGPFTLTSCNQGNHLSEFKMRFYCCIYIGYMYCRSDKSIFHRSIIESLLVIVKKNIDQETGNIQYITMSAISI
jgi:hypothetical protein